MKLKFVLFSIEIKDILKGYKKVIKSYKISFNDYKN